MKIMINGTLYLQKYDVLHLIHDLKDLPRSFIYETFSTNPTQAIVLCDRRDEFDFRCAYTIPESITWINSHKYICDYDEYIDLSVHELHRTYKSLRKSTEANLHDLYDFSEELDKYYDPSTNSPEYLQYKDYIEKEQLKVKELRYKTYAIGSLIRYREGETNFNFPPEYRGLVRNTSLWQRILTSLTTPVRQPKLFRYLRNRLNRFN